MDFFIVAFLIYVLSGTKINRKEFYEDYLSIKYTNQLRGIFVIVVICHHLAQQISTDFLFYYFRYVGHLAVSIFFFISGYGLMIQYKEKKEEYLKSLFKLQIPKIFIPYMITTIIYLVVRNVIGKEITVKDALLTYIDHDTILPASWFIFALIIFYIIFYYSCKLWKKNSSNIIISVFIGLSIYSIACYILNYHSYWFNSCFTFCLGVIWAVYQKQIIKSVNNHYPIIFCACSALFLLFFLPLVLINDRFSGGIIKLICEELSAILFCISVILLGEKVQFRNKMLGFVGNISFETYLIQGVVMLLLRNDRWNLASDVLYSTIVLLGSVLFAIVLHEIYKSITDRFIAFILLYKCNKTE